MKRPVVLALLACAYLVPQVARASHSIEGHYSTSTTPVIGVSCSPDCLDEPGLNIGGYTFPAEFEVPKSLRIVDASGGPVAFSVGQDLNADGFSGDEGEPSVTGCGTSVDLSTSAVPFRADKGTAVFITAVNPVGCTGVATSGTLILSF